MIGERSDAVPGIFLASIALLALEVAQVRVFSYSLDPLLVFSAISVALLGMGAGAIAVSIRPKLVQRPSAWLSGFAVTIVLAHVLFARTSDSIGFSTSAGVLASALPILSILVVPYFVGGAYVADALSRAGADVPRLYLANLVGSGVGSVMVHPLLPIVGAEGLLAIVASIAALSAVVVDRRSRSAIAIAVVCLATVPFATKLFPFRPDPGDLYGVARAALGKKYPGRDVTPVREWSRWDPVARVEVWSFPAEFGFARANGQTAPMRLFAQDGGAGSMLVDVRDRPEVQKALFEGTVYGGAYLLKPRPPRALIVGLGGAPDVSCALHHGAGTITGIEINQAAIDVVGTAYAQALGAPYQQHNVTILHRDGRGFIEGAREKWDLIQMTGADTYAAGAAGAFMFSESYLYTVEGFRRWISALDDDGVLSVIRFGLEPIRVVTTELEALRQLGVAEPSRHIVVLRQGIWVNVLVSKRALDQEAVGRLLIAVRDANRRPRLEIPVYDALGFGLGDPIDVLWAPGGAAKPPYSEILGGREAAFLANAPLDFSPVPDDRPFFFQFLGPKQLGRVLSAKEDDWYARGLRAHLVFLASIAVLATVLILLPVFVSKRRASASLGYFALLGTAYLVVELSWMQETALFLGHPTYSVVTVLVSLLIGSGLGSGWSGRSALSPHALARRAAFAVAAALVVAELALPSLVRALLPAPLLVRVLVLAVVTAPLGFAMGIPFPSGLRAVRDSSSADADPIIAWGIAGNAFASIVASLVVVPIALYSGFRAIGIAAAVLYALAGLVAPRSAQSATTT
ncbi:MAG: hypothetical protein ACXWVM_05355 [Polyangiales bacterium]